MARNKGLTLAGTAVFATPVSAARLPEIDHVRSHSRGFLFVLVVSQLNAGDPDNPFRKAKVGDWVEYRKYEMKAPFGNPGHVEEMTKMTVTSKDDVEAIYEVATKVTLLGKSYSMPIEMRTVDLQKPYDRSSIANLECKTAKTGSNGGGEQTIKIGNKEYATKWTVTKTTLMIGNRSIEIVNKMWFSNNVPLSGLVKMETSTGDATTTLELTGSSIR